MIPAVKNLPYVKKTHKAPSLDTGSQTCVRANIIEVCKIIHGLSTTDLSR